MRYNSSLISSNTSFMAALNLRLPKIAFKDQDIWKAVERRTGRRFPFPPVLRIHKNACITARNTHNGTNATMKPTKDQQQKTESPPIDLIEKVVNGPHDAIRTYFKLWKAKDEKNNILIRKTNVQETFYMTAERFLRDIVCLSSENILEWHKETKDMRVIYHIHLKA